MFLEVGNQKDTDKVSYTVYKLFQNFQKNKSRSSEELKNGAFLTQILVVQCTTETMGRL